MNTRRRFLLVAVVFFVILFVSGFLTVSAVKQANEWSQQDGIASNVVKNLSALSNTSNVYLIDVKPQVINQWTSEYNFAYSNLSSLRPLTSTERPLTDTIMSELQVLKQNMSSIGATLTSSPNQTTGLTAWNLVNPEIENLTANSMALSSTVNQQANQAQQESFVYFFIFAALLAAFVVIIYTQIFGTTVKSIERLERHEKDLTQYNEELEKAVEDRTRQLKESERLAGIGQTAGMVGHDIRNPLQAIISDLYLLKSDLDNVPEGQARTSMEESVDSIEKNVVYINKIVADLQDYARPLIPEYSEVDTSEVITNLFKTITIPENIELIIKVKAFAKLNVDQMFLRRALTNLVNNAIQAMPDGGKLEIASFEKDDSAYIVVSDTGAGIPEEVKAKLFTPMMTTKAKGQGLGLAVVKRLIEALGGHVTFESQEGKGTKFIIALPLKS